MQRAAEHLVSGPMRPTTRPYGHASEMRLDRLVSMVVTWSWLLNLGWRHFGKFWERTESSDVGRGFRSGNYTPEQ